MLKNGKLIALERTADLLRKFSAQFVEFRLAGGALPAALGAVLVGQAWRVPVKDAAAIEHVLTSARSAGCLLEDVNIHKADLEDVFLSLTADAPQVAA